MYELWIIFNFVRRFPLVEVLWNKFAECHMVDRPPAPASRAGRPRTRSSHQSPHVPASKVGRPRLESVYQPKVKELKKNLTKQKSVMTTPPL